MYSRREKRRFEVEKMTLDTQELDEYVKSENIDRNRLKMAFVSGGQGGGSISSEFCRLGYPLVAYNTCIEDLDDLQEKIDNMESHGPFTRIDLNGFGGASKDRDLGLMAIKSSGAQLKEKLLSNKDLHEADFVWVVVALGGGTGNGSLASVCKMLSDYVRANKKSYSSGKFNPTLGVIAAIPDQAARTKIRINVAKAIEELELLQKNGDVGAVLLLDNQKLINDFRRNYKPSRDMNKTWVTDGNNKVARILTELALSTSIKSSSVLDVTEMLSIWSTPGFMTIGKTELRELWMYKKCRDKNVDDMPLNADDLEKRRLIMGEMIKESFSESIFVEGTDLSTAVAGGMLVVSDGKSITSMDAKDLQDALDKDVIDSDTIDTPHYGYITTDLVGVINKQEEDSEELIKEEGKLSARIFTMCVSQGAPAYIKTWFEEAIKSKEKHEEAKRLAAEKEGLDSFSDKLNSISNEPVKNNSQKISLDSIFGGVSNLEQLNSEREANLSDLDKFFNTNSIFNNSNEDSSENKSKDLLSQLYNMEQ